MKGHSLKPSDCRSLENSKLGRRSGQRAHKRPAGMLGLAGHFTGCRSPGSPTYCSRILSARPAGAVLELSGHSLFTARETGGGVGGRQGLWRVAQTAGWKAAACSSRALAPSRWACGREASRCGRRGGDRCSGIAAVGASPQNLSQSSRWPRGAHRPADAPAGSLLLSRSVPLAGCYPPYRSSRPACGTARQCRRRTAAPAARRAVRTSSAVKQTVAAIQQPFACCVQSPPFPHTHTSSNVTWLCSLPLPRPTRLQCAVLVMR